MCMYMCSAICKILVGCGVVYRPSRYLCLRPSTLRYVVVQRKQCRERTRMKVIVVLRGNILANNKHTERLPHAMSNKSCSIHHLKRFCHNNVSRSIHVESLQVYQVPTVHVLRSPTIYRFSRPFAPALASIYLPLAIEAQYPIRTNPPFLPRRAQTGHDSTQHTTHTERTKMADRCSYR